MADNPYNNKVQLANGTVLLDLTEDTITSDDLLSGVTAHDASGAPIVGTLRSMTLTEIYNAVQEGWGGVKLLISNANTNNPSSHASATYSTLDDGYE